MSVEKTITAKLDALFTLAFEGGIPPPDPETATPEEWSRHGGIQILRRELGDCLVLIAREIDLLRDGSR